MYRKLTQIQIDRIGVMASLLCAVHCSVIPLALAYGALAGLSWMTNPVLEVLFIGTAMIAAFFSVSRSLHRHDHAYHAMSFMILGFVLIISSHALFHSYEILFATLGGISIASGHFINGYMSQKCRKCEH